MRGRTWSGPETWGRLRSWTPMHSHVYGLLPTTDYHDLPDRGTGCPSDSCAAPTWRTASPGPLAPAPRTPPGDQAWEQIQGEIFRKHSSAAGAEGGSGDKHGKTLVTVSGRGFRSTDLSSNESSSLLTPRRVPPCSTLFAQVTSSAAEKHQPHMGMACGICCLHLLDTGHVSHV